MPSAVDTAVFILKSQGEMTAMKLQKLVYYSQAWSLVWESQPLFRDRIEAWANGPVCPSLYGAHKGKFRVTAADFGNASDEFSEVQVATMTAVLKYYGKFTPQQLSELTHREDPWKKAREGLDPGERGSKEITHAAMVEYYESLL